MRLSLGETHGVISCADHASIACNRDTSHTDIILWNELVGALVLAKVPNPHITTAIAADELSLVWMNDYVVDRNTMSVVALDVAGTRVPDLDRAIFGRGDKPLRLAVKRDASDV